MKKILFASTALVAASMMHAGAAEAADKIKLNIGGFSKWWVVGVWQSTEYQGATSTGTAAGNNLTSPTNGSGQRSNLDVKGDNEIWFSGSTQLDNGLKVGVFVSLEAGGHTDVSTDVIDASYAWVEGGFGKVMAGTAPNGTALIHVQAPDAATGSIGGSILGSGFAVAKPTSVIGMNQIVGWSSTTNTTAIVVDDKAEKLTYVAPSFYGLTLGASYIPNVARQDSRAVPLNRSAGYGVGALYTNTFGPVGVKASAGYVYVDLSSAGNVGVDNYQAQSYGMHLSYAGFTLGGSFQKAVQDNSSNTYLTNSVIAQSSTTVLNGTINLAATKGGNALDFGGQAYDVGLQYASGPYAVSFGYFHSEVNGIMNPSISGGRKDEIDFLIGSAKYNLGPGVDALASAGYAEFRDQRKGTMGSSDAAYENTGWTAMTGLSLAF